MKITHTAQNPEIRKMHCICIEAMHLQSRVEITRRSIREFARPPVRDHGQKKAEGRV